MTVKTQRDCLNDHHHQWVLSNVQFWVYTHPEWKISKWLIPLSGHHYFWEEIDTKEIHYKCSEGLSKTFLWERETHLNLSPSQKCKTFQHNSYRKAICTSQCARGNWIRCWSQSLCLRHVYKWFTRCVAEVIYVQQRP